MEFTHLHVHSHYSTLDGANRIPDLIKRAQSLGMTALALSDHGNLFGAMEFYHAARKAGIKPILGMEAYVAPGRRDDRTPLASGESALNHLLLLAMNEEGWRNLMILSSRAYLEGFYYKPRVDRELLAQFNRGLIATSACLAGEIPKALLAGDEARARRIGGEYRDIFGPERFFIEIQRQGEAEQERVNPMLIRLARELGVGLVATNDVHFLSRESQSGHDVLTCISTNKLLSDEDRLKYSQELYLKSPAEMAEVFRDWPEAVRNTMRIAEMCNLKLDTSKKHLPVFRTPDGSSPDEYLRRLAEEGLAARFGGSEVPEDYRRRLAWELQVIALKGYSSYFLIVNDFVQFARQNGIPAMPRGSGVATLLGYALGIAQVDPVRYGLLFERFTDPQRQEDPDVDVDVCQIGRERVIRYVREKYRHVAQIITFATIKARQAIRDAGRVMGYPLAETDRLAKMVPEELKATLAKAIDPNLPPEEQRLFSPELRAAYENNPDVRKLLHCAMQIEGLVRQPGVHAAGVVVCDEPLENLVPLCRQSDSPDVITQWDGPTCEKAGMMKMDILGLKTLSVIQRARELVRERTGRDIDPNTLPLDDPQVFEIFRNGETDGVFQFESAGMKRMLIDMQPSRIEDLIAANAMYRPGPMELMSVYSRRKRGEAPVEKIHPLVDDLLAETYGIMIYQEQVMQVLNRLGGLPLSRALTLIKAISKKKKEVIDQERPAFIEGARKNGIETAEAERLFDLILKFAGYGFNKAHSTGYAIVAYQTAWFKCHYPLEFWAANLTFESDDRDKLVQYMADARRMGVKIAPPSINASGKQFTVDGDRIRFGLLAVKGVGEAALEAILAARAAGGPFRDLFDFCERLEATRAVNRGAIEALIRCGAFDDVGGGHRAALLAALPAALAAAQRAARDRQSGQMDMFGNGAQSACAPTYPAVTPWSRRERMAAEKETMGFYISEHPLDPLRDDIGRLAYPEGFAATTLADATAGARVAFVARVAVAQPTPIRSGASAGRFLCRLVLEDLSGRCEAVIFNREWETCSTWVAEDALLWVAGEVDRSRERPQLKVSEAVPLATLLERQVSAIRLLCSSKDLATPERLEELARVVREHSGRTPVDLCVNCEAGNVCRRFTLRTGMEWRVTPTPELLAALRALFGARAVRLDLLPVEAPAPRRYRPQDA